MYFSGAFCADAPDIPINEPMQSVSKATDLSCENMATLPFSLLTIDNAQRGNPSRERRHGTGREAYRLND
jgi:hypothetical protein